MAKTIISQLDFINRHEEKKYLNRYFNNIPNAILFLYGPKSCGKSTLITKTISNLDNKKYAINHINLRGTIIKNFDSFLNIFFQEDEQKTKKNIKSLLKAITLNIGFFKLTMRDKEIFAKNPFKIMEDQLRKMNEKGIRPVIIIDEIQNLKSIYINGERRLLDELFNFFIRLTKEVNLAHIVLATSDSYFIHEIYNSAKLAKTSEFYFIDHLQKKDIEKWLGDPKYNLAKKDIETIYKYFGGSPWEIHQILTEISNKDANLKKIIKQRIDELFGKVFDFYNIDLENQNHLQSQFKKISKLIAKDGFYKVKPSDKLSDILKLTIEKDFWFYKASEQKIRANSPSLKHCFTQL